MPAPGPLDADSLKTPAHFATYAGAVADTDLTAEGLAPCRWIRAKVAGTLVVKRASDGASVTLNFTAGETQFVSALALVAAGSSATDITVFW